MAYNGDTSRLQCQYRDKLCFIAKQTALRYLLSICRRASHDAISMFFAKSSLILLSYFHKAIDFKRNQAATRYDD